MLTKVDQLISGNKVASPDAILEQGDEVLGQLSEGEINKLEAWNSQPVQGSFQVLIVPFLPSS